MKTVYFTMIATAVLIFASNAFGQNTNSAEKSENPQWKVVVTDNLAAKKKETSEKKKAETEVLKPQNETDDDDVKEQFSLNASKISEDKKVSADDEKTNEKSAENSSPEAAKKVSEWEKTWSILAKFSASFDTNLEHEPEPTRAFGFVPSVTAGYQMRSSSHRIKFIYAFAAPRYTMDTDLNRFGNYFAASYRYSLGKWSFETDGEVSLKGTNEDRETSDQYILTETIGYRFDKKTRLNLYGAYRVRRFIAEDADRNAVNPMLGLKFSRQLTKKIDWNIAYRYDENRAVSARQNYIRTTYKTGFDIQFNSDNLLETEFSYRPRRYKNRLVEIGNAEVLRRDQKWSFDAVWKHNFSRRWGFEAGYQFEKQNSNDAEKIYRNHQIVFSIFYHWGNGDIIEP